MKENMKISNAVIKRLPRYHRYLDDLLKKDKERISSNELSEIMGYTASQVRQDFNNFGGFGQQGYGYNIADLHREIGGILGLSRNYNVALVGAGNLGRAIANYTRFYREGYMIKAVFDIKPELIGEEVNDVKVQDVALLGEYLSKHKIDIAIICTSKDSAQDVTDVLCSGKVKGIWNFAPVDLEVSDKVALENVALRDSLHLLTYYINR